MRMMLNASVAKITYSEAKYIGFRGWGRKEVENDEWWVVL